MKTRWRIAIAAAAIAAIGSVVAVKRSRPRFDMPKTLAALADREGVWDNQWNQHDEKIADLAPVPQRQQRQQPLTLTRPQTRQRAAVDPDLERPK